MAIVRVLVIDLDLGNIGSLMAALDRLGVYVKRLNQPPNDADSFSHVVLPGVGAYSAGMDALNSRGWNEWLRSIWTPLRKPLLGICLGMQLLSTRGFEGTDSGKPINGLNLIPGEVIVMNPGPDLVLPHVGWNNVHILNFDHPLFQDIVQDGDFYFVHSYAFQTQNDEHAQAVSHYGESFVVVVGDSILNVWGMQFHPEKSQKLGRRLLSNFLELKPC
jgi:glutamine amidotransferase